MKKELVSLVRSRRRAFTLIELLISCAILAMIVAGIWFLIVHSRRNSRITGAKQILEQEIRLIIDHLNKDLSSAVKGSFVSDFDPDNPRTGDSWELNFEVTEGADNEAGEVSYYYEDGTLSRSGSAGERVLSEHLTECLLEPKNEADEGAGEGPFKGKVSVNLEGKIIPYSPHEGVIFNQGSTVVMRQLYFQDKRWRSTINPSDP